MTARDAEAPAASAPTREALRERVDREKVGLDRELAEIEMLITQARIEAARHEGKRAAVAEKVASLGGGAGGGGYGADPRELLELKDQLVGLTRRAVLMEAQVDVLAGKQKTLTRFRDSVAGLGEALESAGALDQATADPSAPGGDGNAGGEGNVGGEGNAAPVPPAVARIILGAQEDLRREIARAMHDGPAQSLTNIVLQAQIVERLVAKDPAMARGEVRLLVSMVQQTLEATKSFIFEVRPMVLDDLGLVPTIRRAARERGRRAQIPVDFESLGTDRRLPMDLESGLFRILDEALVGYLGAGPDRVSIQLDWADDRLEAHVASVRALVAAGPGTEPEPLPDTAGMPPALAEMVEARRADRAAADEAARVAAIAALPPVAWREIQQRAATIGVAAKLLAEGGELRLVADVQPAE